MPGWIEFTHENGEAFVIDEDGVQIYRAGDLATEYQDFTQHTVVVESNGMVQSAGFESNTVSTKERKLTIEPVDDKLELIDHGKHSETTVKNPDGKKKEIPEDVGVIIYYGANIDFAHNSNIKTYLAQDNTNGLKHWWRLGLQNKLKYIERELSEWESKKQEHDIDEEKIIHHLEMLENEFLQSDFVEEDLDAIPFDPQSKILELKNELKDGIDQPVDSETIRKEVSRFVEKLDNFKSKL